MKPWSASADEQRSCFPQKQEALGEVGSRLFLHLHVSKGLKRLAKAVAVCYGKGRKGGRECRERGRYGSRKSTRRKAGGGVGRGEGYQLRHSIRGQLDKDEPN